MRLAGWSEMPIVQQKHRSDSGSNVRKKSLVQCFTVGYESESDINSDEDAELQKIQKVGLLSVSLGARPAYDKSWDGTNKKVIVILQGVKEYFYWFCLGKMELFSNLTHNDSHR